MEQVVLFFPRPWPGKEMAGRIPLSLLHLFSYLKDSNYEIKILDERVIPEIPLLINEFGNNILCFGISSFTGIQIKNGLRIARQLKVKYPHIPIIWGGWHPSCLPDQTLQNHLVDIVVRGQGEETFKHLLSAISNREPLSGVKGISYKQNGAIFHNPMRELKPVLESLKLSYDAINVENYIYSQPWGNRAIGIITSLGCPFACGFCAVASVYNRKTFFRNIDYVLEELDYLVDRYKINAITFDDDNFFVSAKRVKEFCEKLIRKPYRIAWDAGAHVGLLLKHYDDDMLRLIKESGCQQLYIGAESGSDEVLEMINKKAHVADTFEYVKKMKDFGIRSFLSTMVCFPGVETADIYTTLDMITACRKIDPNIGFRLFYYTPYPSTPLYKKAVQMGMKEPRSLEEWSTHTLRKFKAPWIKKTYRNQVMYFYFYYFPYSSNQPLISEDSRSLLMSLVKVVYRLIFVNRLLRALSRWRVKNGYYKFPLDAWFVIQGKRMKSWYNLLIKKQDDLFQDYD